MMLSLYDELRERNVQFHVIKKGNIDPEIMGFVQHGERMGEHCQFEYQPLICIAKLYCEARGTSPWLLEGLRYKYNAIKFILADLLPHGKEVEPYVNREKMILLLNNVGALMHTEIGEIADRWIEVRLKQLDLDTCRIQDEEVLYQRLTEEREELEVRLNQF